MDTEKLRQCCVDIVSSCVKDTYTVLQFTYILTNNEFTGLLYKCDDVIPFCVFLVHLLARGWRDWFRSSPHYFAILTSLQKGIIPSYRPCFIYETSPFALAFVYFLRLNILVFRFILYSFGKCSRPINARFINHYQCMIFITLRLTNFAEFTHIDKQAAYAPRGLRGWEYHIFSE